MYILNGQNFQENPDTKIGLGCEGIVIPDPLDQEYCIKLFHEPTQPRARKIGAFCKTTFDFPKRIIRPLVPVTRKDGLIIGFRMLRLPKKSFKIKEVFDRTWCVKNGINTKDIALLFLGIWEDLIETIHKNDCLITDINHGAIMLMLSKEHAFVDVDSWGIPGFPSLALTEVYVHPSLYGNLDGSCYVAPERCHDYFAMTILMVRSLMGGLHPFKLGRHKDFKGMRDRTINKKPIFDDDVSYPKNQLIPEMLSDDLLHAIIATLKQQSDAPLSLDILREYANGLIKCDNCGIEYPAKRPQCPACSKKTIVTFEKLVKVIFQALGPILHYQLVDNKIWFVALERGIIKLYVFGTDERVEQIDTNIRHTYGARYLLFKDKLVVCQDPYGESPVALQLFSITTAGVVPFKNTTTGVLEGSSAVFSSSGKFLYRVVQNTLKCCQPFNQILLEEQVAQVYKTQSWLIADSMSGSDHECLFGYHRALRELTWFIIYGTSNGDNFSYHDVNLQLLKSHESMRDFSVYFSSDAVLLVRKTEYRGREYIRYSVIGLNGQVVSDKIVEDEYFEVWENIRGKVFHKGIVMHPTDKGMVKHVLATNIYEPIAQTANDILGNDALMRLGSMLVVVRGNMVFTISKSR